MRTQPSTPSNDRPIPRRARLRTRMLLWTVGLAGLILIGLLFWNDLHFRARLTESAKHQARFIAAGSVDQIDAKLGPLQGAIDGVALLLEVQFDELTFAELKSFQQALLRRFPEIYGTALALLPERQPPGWQALSPYSYRDGDQLRYQDLGQDNRQYLETDWFALPRDLHQPIWTEPYIENTGAKMVTYSAPIYLHLPEGQVFVGVVTCDIELSWLARLMASLPLGEQGYGLLISRNGTYLTHPRDTLAFHESVFRSAEAQGDEQLRQLAQAIRSGRPGLLPWMSPVTGDTSWLAWDVSATTGWTVATVVSQSVLHREVMQLTRWESFAGGLGLLLLMIAVGWVSRSITGPISALSEVAPKLAAGDLDAALPTAQGNDEVAQLTRTFWRMRDELKHYIADLQETTAARERIHGELRIAHDIQMDLVPKTFPAFPDRQDMDLYAIIKPAREVGGDFYDFLLLDDQHIMLAIADVSGKGIPAALFMAVTRSLLRSEFKGKTDPCRALERVNDALAENNDSCMFVTLFCAVIDLASGRVDYANAGHNPPIWLPAEGKAQWIEQPRGTAAGIMADITYKTGHVTLAPGDALILYTDGVNEAMDRHNHEYGTGRLLDLIATCRASSCRDCLESLLDDVHRHAGDAEQSDDITMLMFRLDPADASLACASLPASNPIQQREHLLLDNDVSALAELADWLADYGQAHAIDAKTVTNLNLALDELITNITSYAYPENGRHQIRLELWLEGDSLRAELTDTGIPFNPLEAPQPTLDASLEEREIGGLGVHFVRHLMDDASYCRDDGANKLRLMKTLPSRGQVDT